MDHVIENIITTAIAQELISYMESRNILRNFGAVEKTELRQDFIEVLKKHEKENRNEDIN